ncbi:MAG: 2-hydroxyacyl-CoA dehydratase family protein, partial [Sphingomonas sp.]
MSDTGALARLFHAADAPHEIAAEFRAAGGRVVWTLGWDLPRALVDAFGLHPVRLVPAESGDAEVGSGLGSLIGSDSLGARGRSLIATIAGLPAEDAVLISHADAEQPQLFATLRELARCGLITPPPIHFLDLLTIDRPATRRYNRIRTEQAMAWLGALDGAAAPELGHAIRQDNCVKTALQRVLSLRGPRLSGADAHRLIAASAILSPDELLTLLPAAASGQATPAGKVEINILLSGSEVESPALIESLEAEGVTVIGEDHGWGADRAARTIDETSDPIDAVAAATLEPIAGPFATVQERAAHLATRCAAHLPDRVLHIRFAGDDGSAWEAAALHRALPPGVPFLTALLPDDLGRVGAFLRGENPTPDHAAAVPDAAPAPRAPRQTRSRKSLAAISRFGAYQRDWFAEIRAEAGAGDTFAVVNANTPQEILRALGIPFVVNQWWASIAAAKQQSARYAGLLVAHDLPPAAEAYSSQGVAATFDDDAEKAPWGGLPTPDFLGTVLNTDATSKLFETWSSLTGAKLHRFQRSVESRWEIPANWWDGLAEDWDTL